MVVRFAPVRRRLHDLAQSDAVNTFPHIATTAPRSALSLKYLLCQAGVLKSTFATRDLCELVTEAKELKPGFVPARHLRTRFPDAAA